MVLCMRDGQNLGWSRMAEVLEVEKGPLPRGAIYDIIDNVYPDGDWSKDQQRRKLTASRRHRVRKRLLGSG